MMIPLLLVLVAGGPVLADYRADIGATALADALGSAVPTGEGVMVTQVEALSNDSWMPDTTGELDNKTIIDKTGGSPGVSSHATNVAGYFYGSVSSIAPDVDDIDVYSATDYLGSGFLWQGYTLNAIPVQPTYDLPSYPHLPPWDLASPARITNHSWVGTTGDSVTNGEILRRLDFVVAADQSIQIAAVNNGGTTRPLLANAYNIITVGRTDINHPQGTATVDDLYDNDRVCPLLVVPTSPTSYTAPVVGAAAALLVEKGNDASLSTDPLSITLGNRDGATVAYNAQSALVIKAAFLAGAQRVTHNTTTAEIVDYRTDSANRGSNGLDTRYGAGQLDVYNSHAILAAREQNSKEDQPGGGGSIGAEGFDYDPAFGGGGSSNTTATYYFTPGDTQRRLYACLAWHLKIDGGSYDNYVGTATRFDLALNLTDITDPEDPQQVAESDSTVENTENLWIPLVSGRNYRLAVTLADGQTNCLLDYALAWRMVTPPDGDTDGMPDDWEVQYGFDMDDASDGVEDRDSDLLSNASEASHGTDPDNADSDGDGFMDGEEDRNNNGIVDEGETDPNDKEDYPNNCTHDEDDDGDVDGIDLFHYINMGTSVDPSTFFAEYGSIICP